MKCVHCNGEHPDGFKFCPVTGKEIVQTFKACTNPECADFEKHILPPDALFCPRCGLKIGTSSKDDNEDSLRVIDKFYPIGDFWLGKTSPMDYGTRSKGILLSHDRMRFSCFALDSTNGNSSYNVLWIEKHQLKELCYEWEELGFNGQMTYAVAWTLLEDLYFEVEGNGYNHQDKCDSFKAIASDKSIGIRLCFDHNNGKLKLIIMVSDPRWYILLDNEYYNQLLEDELNRCQDIIMNNAETKSY